MENSKGIPHILEHSVLCGSRKYPIKEPFVELMKGSLNTFLNAFTYPDRTCYPVASANLQVRLEILIILLCSQELFIARAASLVILGVFSHSFLHPCLAICQSAACAKGKLGDLAFMGLSFLRDRI